MRRIGIIGAAWLLSALPVWAGNMGVVSGSYINVRDAGRINSSQVAKRFKGERFEILNEKDNWLEVQFPDGTRGWIAKWLVKTGKEAETIVQDQIALASAAVESLKPTGPKILAPRHMIETSLPPAASAPARVARPMAGEAGSGEGSVERVLPHPPVPMNDAGSGSRAVKPGAGSNAGSQAGSASGERVAAGSGSDTGSASVGQGSDEVGSDNGSDDEPTGAATTKPAGKDGDKGTGKAQEGEKLTAKEKAAKDRADKAKAAKEKADLEKAAKKDKKDLGKTKPDSAVDTAAGRGPGEGSPLAEAVPPKTGSSRSAEDYYNQAIDFFEKKQYQQALDANIEAAKAAPGNAEILNNTGNCHFKLGNFREAVGVWLEALKLNPKSAKICNNLGIAYYQMDENAKSVEYYKKAVLFDPDFADPYYNLASVYGFKGQYQDAIDQYAKYLSRVPDASMKQLTEERIEYCKKQLKSASKTKSED